MKRTSLRRRAKLRVRKPLRRTTPLLRTPSLAATDAQRAAVAGRRCIVCGAESGVDPRASHLPVARRLRGSVVRGAAVPSAGVTVRSTVASLTCCRILSPCWRAAARARRRARRADRGAAPD